MLPWNNSSIFSVTFSIPCDCKYSVIILLSTELNLIIIHLDFIVVKNAFSLDPINIIVTNSGGSSNVFNKLF